MALLETKMNSGCRIEGGPDVKTCVANVTTAQSLLRVGGKNMMGVIHKADP